MRGLPELAGMPFRRRGRRGQEVETMGTETCPSCNNRGPHVALMCGPQGCRETIRACDFCGGLGIVEIKAANRYREGHRLRDMQVEAGPTQMGLGAILKISPITINAI